GAVTLPAQATASPPAFPISATTSAAGASSRSLTTTRAPSEASLSASDRPIPRPDPVISATFPASFDICFLLFPCSLLRKGYKRIARQRLQAAIGHCADFKPHQLLAIALEFLHDLAAACNGGMHGRY